MTKQTQINRRGAETWEVTRLTKIEGDIWDYELIGRVVKDGHFYYIEVPLWQDKGFAWHRPEPQLGSMLPTPLFKMIAERREAAS